MISRCLAVTVGGSISKCGRLSRAHYNIVVFTYLLTYLIEICVECLWPELSVEGHFKVIHGQMMNVE